MVGLIVLFSFAVAVSLLWLGGVGFYVFAKIGFAQLFGLPVNEIAMIAATAFAPLAALWLVTGLLYNVMTLKKQGNTINLLLTQTRRSADHAEAMVRTLMEAQIQTRSAMVLHNADLFINELNDLLSDILVRFGLVQAAHTELIWQRVGNGNKWAFCKVLLLNAENSPHFKEDLKNRLMRDDILSNAVRTFCYRFEQMFTMLERHDIEHYLTKIFEEGALGRVYLRFVEACREVDRPEPQAYMPPEPVEEEAPAESVPDEQPAAEAEETYFPDPEPLPDPEPESDEVSPFGFLRPTR
ncbi:MAG TPA: hypothetical protein DD624_02145 [Alphaproteobacteria bacterium]|nr:hypothetical protein [Alphaproteobacteria bacterium]